MSDKKFTVEYDKKTKDEKKEQGSTDLKKTLDSKEGLEQFAFQVAEAMSDKSSVDKSDVSDFRDDVIDEGMLFTSSIIVGFLNADSDTQSEILNNALGSARKNRKKSRGLNNKTSTNSKVDMLDFLIDQVIEDPDMLDNLRIDIPDHVKDVLKKLAEVKKEANANNGSLDSDRAEKLKAEIVGLVNSTSGSNEEEEEDDFEKYKSLSSFDPDK